MNTFLKYTFKHIYMSTELRNTKYRFAGIMLNQN